MFERGVMRQASRHANSAEKDISLDKENEQEGGTAAMHHVDLAMNSRIEPFVDGTRKINEPGS